ncbi:MULTISPECIES: MarR family winged helix-turn-helix transcriptional regulator [Ferrimonas]|uniref:MarR family winged helix-turn-helix transcriptional regulator n=1 Tax=Ferrimonas TaxID=44011 RepID=UPI0003F9CA9A|nr:MULTISPECIES: MarR family transcriptional regulator [Ferrimonas]
MKPQLSDNLCFALYTASNALTRAYRPLLERFDLTYGQYLVMQALWLEDRVSLTELSRQTRLDPGSLTPVVKRLEGKGMLTRTVSSEDERRKVIALTETGQALQQQAAALKTELEQKTDIDPEVIDTLRRHCLTLADQLTRVC